MEKNRKPGTEIQPKDLTGPWSRKHLEGLKNLQKLDLKNQWGIGRDSSQGTIAIGQ